MARALSQLDARLALARQKQEQGSTTGPALVQALVGAFRNDAELCRELLKAGRSPRQTDLEAETLHFLAIMAESQRLWPDAEHYYRRSLARLTDPNGSAVIQGGLLRLLWKTHKYHEVVDLCREALKAPKAQHAAMFHSE